MSSSRDRLDTVRSSRRQEGYKDDRQGDPWRASDELLRLVPRRARTEILEAAQYDDPVLITGPTGSGKTWLAQLVHHLSKRSRSEYVSVNCAALPSNLIESELFGHERGAFTDARERRVGMLEAGAGGTVLLDEIGMLPIQSQAKLLTFLDSMTFRRVGGTTPITIDTRIISATAEDLSPAVSRPRFLDALYYRLAGSLIEVPPLATRRDEIPNLVEYFLREVHHASGSSTVEMPESDAMEFIQSQPFPGNVRELRFAIRRAASRASGKPISLAHLSFWKTVQGKVHVYNLTSERAAPVGSSREQQPRRRNRCVDREELLAALTYERGNKRAAARRLGISPTTLYRCLAHHKLYIPKRR